MPRRRPTTRVTRISTRTLAIAAIASLPLLGLAGWLVFVTNSGDDDRLQPILNEYGYTALTPPSRFFGPGTFVTVETQKDGTLKLHLACEMDQAVLEAMWRRSTTVDRNLVRSVKNSFDAATDALKLVSPQAKGTTARDVNVALRDISIVTMPYESLFGVRTQYLRDACEKAIVWNLRAGASVCQTEEALEADIVYRAKSEDGISAGVEFELPAPAGGSGNVGRNVADSSELQGDDLILGVRVRRSNCLILAANGQTLASGI